MERVKTSSYNQLILISDCLVPSQAEHAPGLVATTILSFILALNEFLFAVILTQKDAKTVPIFIARFITDKGMDWGNMTAVGSVFVLPVIILAWVSQKYLVRGLTLGAVKG